MRIILIKILRCFYRKKKYITPHREIMCLRIANHPTYRLREFCEFQGIEVSQFCEIAGISDQAASALFRRGKLSGDVIYKISSAFPELSLDWLITGDGEMLKTSSNGDSNYQCLFSGGDIDVMPGGKISNCDNVAININCDNALRVENEKLRREKLELTHLIKVCFKKLEHFYHSTSLYK